MIAGGIIVGLIAAQNTEPGKAAEDGLIGAGIVGLIGASLAFLPHSPFAPTVPAYPRYGIGLRFKNPVNASSHTILGIRASR